MKVIDKIDKRIACTKDMTIREIADVVKESPQAVKSALDTNGRAYKPYEPPICEVEQVVAALTQPTTYQELKQQCDVKRWQFYRLAQKYPMLQYNKVKECHEELALIGAMPNYVIRRKLGLTNKQVKDWRYRSNIKVVTLDEIKVIRDLKLSPREVAEVTRFSERQVAAMREEYEGEYTNLEDKIKYFYVEVTSGSKVIYGGMLGKEIDNAERATIIKNVESGIWEIALI